MKQFIRFLSRIKARYYISAGIILYSIGLTPRSIEAAYEIRGYHAIGGEYLLIPLAILTVFILCQALFSWDKFKEKRRKSNVRIGKTIGKHIKRYD